MVGIKRLPVGIDNFEKIRTEGFYYVDKTGMIKELLENWGEVNLFTRPRRFGKTLNMSMLRYFFEIGTDPQLFDGLNISDEPELCKDYMGQYPVISLTLKEVKGLSFYVAKSEMWTAVSWEADRLDRLYALKTGDKLDNIEKKQLSMLRMKEGDLSSSLRLLSSLLYKHLGKKVIILIDEYDVPLQKAEENGYYEEMAGLLSKFFGYGMKTNDDMLFSVVTGCLRISKESIFTGFNNPKVHTILDEQYDEWFGFTDEEVREMLAYYDKNEYYAVTKEWYDGYRFGTVQVYCPWDVINWCDQLRNTLNRFPQNFWANTSSNALISRFADKADAGTREQLSYLLEGGTVRKKLRMDLTYHELDDSIDNLWSVLFMTGYLTQKGVNENGCYWLVIPNREISEIFMTNVDQWFTQRVLDDKESLEEFFDALKTGDADRVEECLNDYMTDVISYLDGGRTGDKENFYHGLLLGMLGRRTGWEIRSNREGGKGRPDIVAYHRRERLAIIIEVKYAKEEVSLEKEAEKAITQILQQQYDDCFGHKKPETVFYYGISFCKKDCRVLLKKKS